MKNNDDIIHLTFPTTRGTNILLNHIAKIKGLTQPKLLDQICRKYIEETMMKMVNYVEDVGINIEELLDLPLEATTEKD